MPICAWPLDWRRLLSWQIYDQHFHFDMCVMTVIPSMMAKIRRMGDHGMICRHGHNAFAMMIPTNDIDRAKPMY